MGVLQHDGYNQLAMSDCFAKFDSHVVASLTATLEVFQPMMSNDGQNDVCLADSIGNGSVERTACRHRGAIEEHVVVAKSSNQLDLECTCQFRRLTLPVTDEDSRAHGRPHPSDAGRR